LISLLRIVTSPFRQHSVISAQLVSQLETVSLENAALRDLLEKLETQYSTQMEGIVQELEDVKQRVSYPT